VVKEYSVIILDRIYTELNFSPLIALGCVTSLAQFLMSSKPVLLSLYTFLKYVILVGQKEITHRAFFAVYYTKCL